MASGKPDVMLLLLNKLLDDGNVLYKVCAVNIVLALVVYKHKYDVC